MEKTYLANREINRHNRDPDLKNKKILLGAELPERVKF
jgi:hypothetical protein